MFKRILSFALRAFGVYQNDSGVCENRRRKFDYDRWKDDSGFYQKACRRSEDVIDPVIRWRNITLFISGSIYLFLRRLCFCFESVLNPILDVILRNYSV